MQPTETDSGSLVRRAGARAAVGHLNHHHSDGELAATPRRTGAAVYQKSKVITTNLFSARHRHTYGPRRAGVSRRAAYACGLSASPRPSRARMKSSQASGIRCGPLTGWGLMNSHCICNMYSWYCTQTVHARRDRLVLVQYLSCACACVHAHVHVHVYM